MDTAAKRFSAMNIMCPWRGVNGFPTGTVDAAERASLNYLYNGIAISEGGGDGSAIMLMMMGIG